MSIVRPTIIPYVISDVSKPQDVVTLSADTIMDYDTLDRLYVDAAISINTLNIRRDLDSRVATRDFQFMNLENP